MRNFFKSLLRTDNDDEAAESPKIFTGLSPDPTALQQHWTAFLSHKDDLTHLCVFLNALRPGFSEHWLMDQRPNLPKPFSPNSTPTRKTSVALPPNPSALPLAGLALDSRIPLLDEILFSKITASLKYYLLSLQSEHVGEYGPSQIVTQRAYAPIRGFEYVCLLFFLSTAPKNHLILIKNGTLTYCLRIVQQCLVHMKTLKKGLIRAATAVREAQAKEKELANSSNLNASKTGPSSGTGSAHNSSSNLASLRVSANSSSQSAANAINLDYANPLNNTNTNLSYTASLNNSTSAKVSGGGIFTAKPIHSPSFSGSASTTTSNQFSQPPSQSRDAQALLRWCLGCWDHFAHLLSLCLGIILNCVKLTVPGHVPLSIRACDLINALALCWPDKSSVEGLGSVDASSFQSPAFLSLLTSGQPNPQPNATTNSPSQPSKGETYLLKTKTMLIQRGLLSSIRDVLHLVDLEFWLAFSGPQASATSSSKPDEQSTTDSTSTAPSNSTQSSSGTRCNPSNERFLKLTLFLTQLALVTTGVVCYDNSVAKLDTCERGVNLLEIMLDNIGGETRKHASWQASLPPADLVQFQITCLVIVFEIASAHLPNSSIFLQLRGGSRIISLIKWICDLDLADNEMIFPMFSRLNDRLTFPAKAIRPPAFPFLENHHLVEVFAYLSHLIFSEHFFSSAFETVNHHTLLKLTSMFSEVSGDAQAHDSVYASRFQHPELQLCFLNLLVRFQEFSPALRAHCFEERDCWSTILSPAFTDLVVLDFEYEIARRYQASNKQTITQGQDEQEQCGPSDSIAAMLSAEESEPSAFHTFLQAHNERASHSVRDGETESHETETESNEATGSKYRSIEQSIVLFKALKKYLFEFVSFLAKTAEPGESEVEVLVTEIEKRISLILGGLTNDDIAAVDRTTSSYAASRLSSVAVASQLVQSLHLVTMFRSASVAQALNHIKGRLRLAQVIGNLQGIKEFIRDSNLNLASSTTTSTASSTSGHNSSSVSLRQYHEHWCFLTVHDAQKILFATLLAYLEADDIGGSAFYKALCVPELVSLLFRLFSDPTMLSYSFSLLVRMMQVDFGMLPLEFTDNPNAMDDVRKNVIPIRSPIKQGLLEKPMIDHNSIVEDYEKENLDATGQKSMIYVDPTDKISSFNIHTLYSKFFDFLKLLSNTEERECANNNSNVVVESEILSSPEFESRDDRKEEKSETAADSAPASAIVYDCPTGAYELLVTLIDKGIPEIIAADGENEQNLFVQASCFTHLLTFLNNAVSNERTHAQQKRLCFGVIRALTHLLRGNSASKQHFKHISGYQHLKTLILRIFEGVPTIEVLGALFNMLVDGTFDRDRSRIIQNVDVVLLIFYLAPHFTFETSQILFETFIAILRHCPVNGSVCSSVGLISLLIDMIPVTARLDDESHCDALLNSIRNMIQIVAMHSVRAEGLKELFYHAKPRATSLCVGGVISLEQLISHEDTHVLMGGRDEETERRDSAAQGKTAWTALQTLHHILNFNEVQADERERAQSQGQPQQQSMMMNPNLAQQQQQQIASGTSLPNSPSVLRVRAESASNAGASTPTAAHSNIFWASTKGQYRVGPNIIFDFDGRQSSFTFPKGVWPPPSGSFAFATWFRIESYDGPSQIRFDKTNFSGQPQSSERIEREEKAGNEKSEKYAPRLFSAINEQCEGFELFLRQGTLYFHSTLINVDSEQKEVLTNKINFDGFVFEPHQWYFLALSCTQTSRLWGRSTEVKISINDLNRRMVLSDLQFHRNATVRVGCGDVTSLGLERLLLHASQQQEGASASGIGARFGTTREHQEVEAAKSRYTFFGQFAAIYLFDAELSQREVTELYQLGPSYDSDFRLHSVVGIDHDSVDRTVHSLSLFESLPPKLYLSYSARSMQDHCCFNQAPNRTPQSLSSLNATAYHVRKFVRHFVKDMLPCIGGVSMVIALFQHLHVPDTEIPGGDHARLGLLLFQIVDKTIRNNFSNQKDLMQYSGFSVIAYLLLHVSPRTLSVPLLRQIQDLLCHGQLPAVMTDDILTHLIFDFELWVYASPDVQRHLLHETIPALIALFPAIRHRYPGVQLLLDLSRLYYWDVPVKKISKARSAPIHQHSIAPPTSGTQSTFSTPSVSSTSNSPLLGNRSVAIASAHDGEMSDSEEHVPHDASGSQSAPDEGRDRSEREQEAEAHSLAMKEMRCQCRKSLLNSLALLCASGNTGGLQGIQKTEVRAIFDYLGSLANTDPRPCLEMLYFLEEKLFMEYLETMPQSNFASIKERLARGMFHPVRIVGLFECVMEEGGVNLFLKLFPSRFPAVQVQVLNVVLLLISILNQTSVKSYRWSSIYSTNSFRLVDHLDGFALLEKVLAPLNLPLFDLLFNLMKDEKYYQKIQDPRMKFTNPVFAPEIVPLLFKLARNAPPFLQELLFQRVIQYFEENPQNISAVMQLPCWLSCIVSYVGVDYLEQLVVSMLHIAVLHALQHFKNGHEQLAHVIASCQHLVGKEDLLSASTSIPISSSGSNITNNAPQIVVTPTSPSTSTPNGLNGANSQPSASNPADLSTSGTGKARSLAEAGNAIVERLLFHLYQSLLIDALTEEMKTDLVSNIPSRALSGSGARDSPSHVHHRGRPSTPTGSSSLRILGDLKRRNSPLLANLVYTMKYTEDFLFDNMPSGSMLSAGYHAVLSAFLDVVETIGFLTPACTHAVRVLVPGVSPDTIRQIAIRMSAYWFYLIPDDGSLIERHVARLSFWLCLQGVDASGQALGLVGGGGNFSNSASSIAKFDRDSCLFVLFHLIKSVKQALGRLTGLPASHLQPLLYLFRELLALYAPILLERRKHEPVLDDIEIKMENIKAYFATMTSYILPPADFFEIFHHNTVTHMILSYLEELLFPLKQEELAKQLAAQDRTMEIAQMLTREAVKHARATNDLRARSEAQMAYLALKSSAVDGVSVSGFSFASPGGSLSGSASGGAMSASSGVSSALNLLAPSSNSANSSSSFAAPMQGLTLPSAPSVFKQRILFKQTQQRIRTKQVQQWQKIVHMYLLIIEKPSLDNTNALKEKAKAHWQLDFQETPARMHIRLKRNYSFDSHETARVHDKSRATNNNTNVSSTAGTSDVDSYEAAATNILRRLGELKTINVRKQRGESQAPLLLLKEKEKLATPTSQSLQSSAEMNSEDKASDAESGKEEGKGAGDGLANDDSRPKLDLGNTTTATSTARPVSEPLPLITTSFADSSSDSSDEDEAPITSGSLQSSNIKTSQSARKAERKASRQASKPPSQHLLATAQCELVCPIGTYKGEFRLTATHLYFDEISPLDSNANQPPTSGSVRNNNTPTSTSAHAHNPNNSNANAPHVSKSWENELIREIHLRRYLLCHTALELFFDGRRSLFLNFPVPNVRDAIFHKLAGLPLPRLTCAKYLSAPDLLRQSGLTEAWQMGELTNFEYLMRLNTIASRSYNDLTQYPVFPWILNDYTSEELRLEAEDQFRDLKLPVGAINPKRKKTFEERFENWLDDTLPPFHYGSHYSSPHTVCHYLMRIEPFTSLGIQLQDGKIDHADRLFHALYSTWKNCLTASADFKELIPEFFYLPEFLLNENEFNFGVKQSGVPLGDVVLPPWAKGSADEFVRLHRLALESEYVSNNLHHWIDLIFGYKQTGEAAVKACNVYHHLTYEGSVDMNTIDDQLQREAIESTIANFGQCPVQLLDRPHPARHESATRSLLARRWQRLCLFSDAYVPVLRKVNLDKYNGLGAPSCILSRPLKGKGRAKRQKLLSTVGMQGPNSVGDAFQVVVIDVTRQVLHQRDFSVANVAPSTGSIASSSGRQSLALSAVTSLLIKNELTRSQAFALSPNGKLLISGGHFDNCIKITPLDSPTARQSLSGHKDIVTNLCLSSNGLLLGTGSMDTTVRIWQLFDTKEFEQVQMNKDTKAHFYAHPKPRYILYGHQSHVTAVALSTEQHVCISGSFGACVIHNLLSGDFIRHVLIQNNEGERLSVDKIIIDSITGNWIVYSQSGLMISMYSLNGRKIRSVQTYDGVVDLCLTMDGQFLVYGTNCFRNQTHNIVTRDFQTLEPMKKHRLDGAIHSLSLLGNYSLLVGTENGLTLLHALASNDGEQ